MLQKGNASHGVSTTAATAEAVETNSIVLSLEGCSMNARDAIVGAIATSCSPRLGRWQTGWCAAAGQQER